MGNFQFCLLFGSVKRTGGRNAIFGNVCAIASVIFVLSQLLISCDGYYLDNNPYMHKQVLGPRASYVVEWSINWKESQITFQVSAETKGWVGFGLSRDGRMSLSDVVIGGVAPSGKPYFDDAHVLENRTVQIDRRQDWKLVGAWEKGKRTYLTMKRPFDTCDPDDYAITRDQVVLIWAYGTTDEVQYHGPKNRGGNPVYLLDPEISEEIAHDHYRQIGPHSNLYLVQRLALTSTIRLVPKPTTVWCSVQRGPRLLQRHDIVGAGPFLPTPEARMHVQQLRVFKCAAPQQADAQTFFEPFAKIKGEECYLNDRRTLPLGFCQELIYVWGRGGKPFYFPEDIGIPIGESQTEYFMLETTYDNPRTLPNLEIEAGVEIIFSHRQKPNSASLIQVGYGPLGTFIIPPKAITNVYGSCGSSCTSTMFPKDGVNVFAAMLQTHAIGRSVRLHHFRNVQELQWILKDDNYDSEFQQMRLLPKRLNVLPGDQITTECTYDSWPRNRTSFSGFSTQDEVCTAYIYIANRIPFFRCTSEYPADKLLNRFGISNFTWDLIWQERYVTVPRDLEGTWLGDIIDHKAHANTVTLEQLQAEYKFNPQVESCPSIKDIASDTQNRLFQTFTNEWQLQSVDQIEINTPYASSSVSYPGNLPAFKDAPSSCSDVTFQRPPPSELQNSVEFSNQLPQEPQAHEVTSIPLQPVGAVEPRAPVDIRFRIPIESSSPVAPIFPVEPRGPEEPRIRISIEPSAPAEPQFPLEPRAPVDTRFRIPIESSSPVAPRFPVEPRGPEEPRTRIPLQPSAPAGPQFPLEPRAPVDTRFRIPIDSSSPVDPRFPVEPRGPEEHRIRIPLEPSAPAEPRFPVGPRAPEEPRTRIPIDSNSPAEPRFPTGPRAPEEPRTRIPIDSSSPEEPRFPTGPRAPEVLRNRVPIEPRVPVEPRPQNQRAPVVPQGSVTTTPKPNRGSSKVKTPPGRLIIRRPTPSDPHQISFTEASREKPEPVRSMENPFSTEDPPFFNSLEESFFKSLQKHQPVPPSAPARKSRPKPKPTPPSIDELFEPHDNLDVLPPFRQSRDRAPPKKPLLDPAPLPPPPPSIPSFREQVSSPYPPRSARPPPTPPSIPSFRQPVSSPFPPRSPRPPPPPPPVFLPSPGPLPRESASPHSPPLSSHSYETIPVRPLRRPVLYTPTETTPRSPPSSPSAPPLPTLEELAQITPALRPLLKYFEDEGSRIIKKRPTVHYFENEVPSTDKNVDLQRPGRNKPVQNKPPSQKPVSRHFPELPTTHRPPPALHYYEDPPKTKSKHTLQYYENIPTSELNVDPPKSENPPALHLHYYEDPPNRQTRPALEYTESPPKKQLSLKVKVVPVLERATAKPTLHYQEDPPKEKSTAQYFDVNKKENRPSEPANPISRPKPTVLREYQPPRTTTRRPTSSSREKQSYRRPIKNSVVDYYENPAYKQNSHKPAVFFSEEDDKPSRPPTSTSDEYSREKERRQPDTEEYPDYAPPQISSVEERPYTKPRIKYPEEVKIRQKQKPELHYYAEPEVTLRKLRRPALSSQELPSRARGNKNAQSQERERETQRPPQRISEGSVEHTPPIQDPEPEPPKTTTPPAKSVHQPEKQNSFDLKPFLSKAPDITIPLIETKTQNQNPTGTPNLLGFDNQIKDNLSFLKFFNNLASFFSSNSAGGRSNEIQSNELAKFLLSNKDLGGSHSHQNQQLTKRQGEAAPAPAEVAKKPNTNNIKLLVVHQTKYD